MKKRTRLQRFDDGLRDFSNWVLLRTGVGWLTPYVGVVDFNDLYQLWGQIDLDIQFLDGIRSQLGPSDQATLKKLDEVRAGLNDLVGRPSEGRAPQFEAVRWPWHSSRGWADYAALRLALYGCMPKAAWSAALFELGNMQSLLLSEAVPTWVALHRQLVATVSSGGDALACERVPYGLQALWREVNFWRDKRRRRVVKQTTIVQITWALLVSVTAALTFWSRLDARADGAPAAWVVVGFGALGGTVSALRNVDFARLVPRSPVETEAVRLRLRPVLGAAVALVAYWLAGLGLVGLKGTTGAFPLQVVVTNREQLYCAYCIVGFAAGFSERWFLRLLDAGLGGSSAGDTGGGTTNSITSAPNRAAASSDATSSDATSSDATSSSSERMRAR